MVEAVCGANFTITFIFIVTFVAEKYLRRFNPGTEFARTTDEIDMDVSFKDMRYRNLLLAGELEGQGMDRQLARRAASRARAKAGNRMAARIPIIAITTSNSMRVNPFFF